MSDTNKPRLVHLVPTGTGSKRVTIPKQLLKEVFGNIEYAAIRKEKSGLMLTPIDLDAGGKMRD